jgi:hypothetical protein
MTLQRYIQFEAVFHLRTKAPRRANIYDGWQMHQNKTSIVAYLHTPGYPGDVTEDSKCIQVRAAVRTLVLWIVQRDLAKNSLKNEQSAIAQLLTSQRT